VSESKFAEEHTSKQTDAHTHTHKPTWKDLQDRCLLRQWSAQSKEASAHEACGKLLSQGVYVCGVRVCVCVCVCVRVCVFVCVCVHAQSRWVMKYCAASVLALTFMRINTLVISDQIRSTLQSELPSSSLIQNAPCSNASLSSNLLTDAESICACT